MGGFLDSRCVGRVYGADGAVHHPHRTQVKVKCTLVQALMLCTGRTAHRGNEV